jgi:MYXO-CTERM domain-containing protein
MVGWLWSVLAVLSLGLVASPARADAIMPLQEPCDPPRVVGVRSHRQVCLEPPPTTCPPGWRGVPGGTCDLAICNDDKSCSGAERCSEVLLCFETRERAYCESDVPFAAGLIAAPPRPCPPEQRSYEIPTGPCGAGTCAGTCKPGKLCVAPGMTPATSGSPGATSGPSGASGPSGTAPPHGGCAGCSAAGSRSETALALLMVAVGALALVRREKRPRSGVTPRG